MKPFPLIPLGQVVVVRVINDDKTAGGLQLPGGMTHDDYVVGEIIASGTGSPTITGAILPNLVDVGDIVIFQKIAARAISYAVRKHIIERGFTDEELNGVCIVMCDNVVGKFLPTPAQSLETENDKQVGYVGASHLGC